MQRYGKTFAVTDPQVMMQAEAAPHVRPGLRPIFANLPFEQAVLLTKAG
jgi:hypothetical protein